VREFLLSILRSLHKDVRYSLDVCIKADKSKLYYDLNIRERDILIALDFLNDCIIDSAMNL